MQCKEELEYFVTDAGSTFATLSEVNTAFHS